MTPTADPTQKRPLGGVLSVEGLDALLRQLQDRGYLVIGPIVQDGAVTYEPIASHQDLPRGTGDEQRPGMYRLRRRDDDAFFGYASAPASWKRYLFPARSPLFRAERSEGSIQVDDTPPVQPRYAFVGVRSCELAAIAIQNRVFLDSNHPDSTYAARSKDLFVVAVSCSDPAGTCFCQSMGTGPEAQAMFDLRLTELVGGSEHRFVVTPGSPAGEQVLAAVPHRPATPADVTAATEVTQRAKERMGRSMDVTDVHDLLLRNREHPRWKDVGSRCLACGNCTFACPTCFCSDSEDANELGTGAAVRTRAWASCFGLDYSSMHGGTIRTTIPGRYRQWMTHKLATWFDQFGTSGCAGCGRCITMCPVGIDITEEVKMIQESDRVKTTGEMQ